MPHGPHPAKSNVRTRSHSRTDDLKIGLLMMPRRKKSTDLRSTQVRWLQTSQSRFSSVGAALRGLTAKDLRDYPVKGPAVDAASLAASIQTAEGEMPLVSWSKYKAPAISVDYQVWNLSVWIIDKEQTFDSPAQFTAAARDLSRSGAQHVSLTEITTGSFKFRRHLGGRALVESHEIGCSCLLSVITSFDGQCKNRSSRGSQS